MSSQERYLRRLLRVGGSIVVSLPKPIAQRFKSSFVWIEPEEGYIKLKEADLR